jgi:hypothetical protein
MVSGLNGAGLFRFLICAQNYRPILSKKENIQTIGLESTSTWKLVMCMHAERESMDLACTFVKLIVKSKVENKSIPYINAQIKG